MTRSTPRRTKTPAQRAQEAVGVAERRVERLEKALIHQRELVETYERDLDDAHLRLEYAEKDPALTAPQNTTTEESR